MGNLQAPLTEQLLLKTQGSPGGEPGHLSWSQGDPQGSPGTKEGTQQSCPKLTLLNCVKKEASPKLNAQSHSKNLSYLSIFSS